ncbi:MAG: SH3 domain-containing protein [Treponema sp.]|nr:SH3 domain-containing protein [Treponema sp.]
MKFNKKILAAAVAMLISAVAFAETYYVSVKSSHLKAKPAGSSKNVTNVSYGDAVTWVKTDGNWTLVKKGNVEGWISSNAITKRKVVSGSKVTTDAKEIALAGKGFGDGIDTENDGGNYTAVNAVERNSVSDSTNESFKAKGGLKVAE